MSLTNKRIPGSPAEWLMLARADLALAKAPLPPGAVYEDLCFHAQQAAEKALKGMGKEWSQREGERQQPSSR
ncbi:MAG: HEPN domain-containing protein [bacterium]